MWRLTVLLVVLLRHSPWALVRRPPARPAPLVPVSGPPRRPRGWRWWKNLSFRHGLPHNSFTVDELADALEQLAAHTAPGCRRTVTITWGSLRPQRREVTVEELRRLTEPERVHKITLAWTYPPETPGGTLATVSGPVVRPLWRGYLIVRQGGWARNDYNRCAQTLARVRPGRAATLDWLFGRWPYLLITIGMGSTLLVVLTVLAAPTPLPLSVVLTVTVTVLGVYGGYYLMASGFVGGTRLVGAEKVAGRSWLSPGLVVAAASPVIALPALVVAIIAL